MEKRIALYYPHTHLTDEQTLKRALLLWDKVEMIVPYEGLGFSPPRSRNWSPGVAEALELIGIERVPSDVEKAQVHEAIDDLTSRALPALNSSDLGDVYEFYPEKIMGETWELLRGRQLNRIGREHADYAVTQNMGLLIMALLADVLAGKSRELFTDRSSAYRALWTALGQYDQTVEDVTQIEAHNSIVAVALSQVNLDDIPLLEVLNFRKREESENAGGSLTSLRSVLRSHIATKTTELSELLEDEDFKARDLDEFLRQLESDARADAISLRQELRANAVQTVFSRDVWTPFVLTAAAGLFSYLPQLAGTAGVISLAGPLASWSKYLQQRLEIQRRHPTSYALLLKGGEYRLL